MIGALTNHLWQSTLFAIAAGLLTIAFRKNRAQVRFWLWFSASIKFLGPFSLLMSLGSHVHWEPSTGKLATQLATPTASFTMIQIAEPFSGALPIAAAPTDARNWLPVAILVAWAFGFVALVLFRFRAWLQVRAALRSSTAMDIPTAVEVRSSPGLLEPGVVGLLHPILLLPEGIVERLTPPQLAAVLAHEICHVRRRDNLFASIHMIVETVFWFHPLVWWIGARLVEERERACDEDVLRQGNEAQAYAEGILNICKLYVESPLVCVSGVTGSDLRKRIEDIMTDRIVLRLNPAKKIALGIAGAVALTAPLVIGVMNAPRLRAQSAAGSTKKFDVAAIKTCKVGEPAGGRKGNMKGGGGGRSSSPGRLSTGCDSVESLIRDAYVMYASGVLIRDPSNPPVEGGPAWIKSERYQINARAEGSPGEGIMMGPMLQTLLEDRFQLKIHRESREVPVYAVSVAKGGPKLQPYQEGSCIVRDNPFRPPTPEEQEHPEKNCRAILRDKGPLVMAEAKGSTLETLLKLLYLLLDRPIVDKTGLTGKFDITIEFARPEGQAIFRPYGESVSPPAAPAADEPAGPSIFSVFEKQLGLKMEASRGPRDFFVIDHVERPTGN